MSGVQIPHRPLEGNTKRVFAFMDQNIDHGELLALSSASEVRIIVHPLYRISAVIDPSYNTARLRQLEYFSKAFGAQSPTEIVLVSLASNSVEGPFGKSIDEEGPDLPDTYDAVHVLKNASPYPANVITIPDIVEDQNIDPHVIENAVKNKGLQITDSTMITLAGEEVDVCLVDAADKLRQLGSITSFRLDKRGILGSGYITDPPDKTKIRENLNKFIHYMSQWEISEDENYITVRKPIT